MLSITLFWGMKTVLKQRRLEIYSGESLTFDGGSFLTPGWCIQHGGFPGVLPCQVPQ